MAESANSLKSQKINIILTVLNVGEIFEVPAAIKFYIADESVDGSRLVVSETEKEGLGPVGKRSASRLQKKKKEGIQSCLTSSPTSVAGRPQFS
jgi:hypothetical protein